jgi:DNA-binding PadR family transcriptional regulator
MSVISTIIDAINPQENEASHREARAKARRVARPGDWLALILEHHDRIAAGFAAVKAAPTAAGQLQAQRRLAEVLTGHANAEESVIYPALSRAAQRGATTTAYAEQATAKQDMAALELLAPLSPAYLEKLEHIRDAIAHHVYEEEGTWLLALQEHASAQEQAMLGQRYREEFERYVGRQEDAAAPASTPGLDGSWPDAAANLPPA